MNTKTISLASALFALFTITAQTASAQEFYNPADNTTQESQFHQHNNQIAVETTPVTTDTESTQERPFVLGVEATKNFGLGLEASGNKVPIRGDSGYGFKIRFGKDVMTNSSLMFIPEGQLQYSSQEFKNSQQTDVLNVNNSFEFSSIIASGGFRVGGYLPNTKVSGFAYLHAGLASTDLQVNQTLEERSSYRTASKRTEDSSVDKFIDIGGTLNYEATPLLTLGVNFGVNALYGTDGDLTWKTLGMHTEFRF